MRLPPLIGPLYREELHRLGRRNAVYAVRVVMAGLLLAAVAVNHPGDGATVGIKAQAAFAADMLVALAGVQLVAIWFLTPLFAAAVLTEEREKKTLDLLLTTPLTGREVVLGKLLARLTFVGAALLAGLPVMAGLQVFGGVTAGAVAVTYLGLFANLWSVGGMAAGIAASQRTYRAALYLTWGALALGLMCPVFGPWYAVPFLTGVGELVWGFAVAYVLIHGFTGLGGMMLAVLTVRPDELVSAGHVVPPGPTPRYRAVGGDPVGVTVVVAERDPPPSLAADIIWDRAPAALDGPSTREVVVGCVVAVIGLGLLLGLAAAETPRPRPRVWPAYMILGWVPAALVAAVQAAGTVTREREADTLTMLLTVPPTRTEILWRKYRGAVVKSVPMGLFTATMTGFIFLTADGREWYPGFLAQGVGMVAAGASVGIVLTVVCRTTFLAQAAAVLGVLLLGALPGWANAVLAEDRVIRFVPVHYAVLMAVAVVGWWLAAAEFRAYAKR